MIQFLKVLMHLALTLVLLNCGNADNKLKQTGNDSASTKEPVIPERKPSEEMVINDDILNAIYLQYLNLSRALTEGNISAAKISSNAIEAGAREMSDGRLIAVSAAKITTASNIEVQRSAYLTLSKEMIALIKKSGLNKGAIYVEYCPMAFDNKGGHWLSSNTEIRNPYFGDEMLTCGEVTDTIK